MVAYFSGTGNSRYIAKLVAEKTDNKLFSINDALKNEKLLTTDDEKIVFVLPVYAWQIPKVVEEWLKSQNFAGKSVYFVLTCGGDMGNASFYIKKLTKAVGADYQGCAQIVMPDNCITMFKAPTEEESVKIIDKAEKSLEAVIDNIEKGQKLPDVKVSVVGKIQSGIVNKSFYRFFVKGDKMHATDLCISCGLCVELCPLNNIKMVYNRPQFSSNCTQCMACLCHCKSGAIEYGKKTKGKNRYLCPKQ